MSLFSPTELAKIPIDQAGTLRCPGALLVAAAMRTGEAQTVPTLVAALLRERFPQIRLKMCRSRFPVD
jgi:hypothetical protein